MIGSARLSRKHQVVIPKEARKELGIEAGDEVLFEVRDGRDLWDSINQGLWYLSSLSLALSRVLEFQYLSVMLVLRDDTQHVKEKVAIVNGHMRRRRTDA